MNDEWMNVLLIGVLYYNESRVNQEQYITYNYN